MLREQLIAVQNYKYSKMSEPQYTMVLFWKYMNC